MPHPHRPAFSIVVSLSLSLPLSLHLSPLLCPFPLPFCHLPASLCLSASFSVRLFLLFLATVVFDFLERIPHEVRIVFIVNCCVLFMPRCFQSYWTETSTLSKELSAQFLAILGDRSALESLPQRNWQDSATKSPCRPFSKRVLESAEKASD